MRSHVDWLIAVLINMIGKLKGLLIEVGSHKGLIETTSGVFYTVFLTPALIKRQKIRDSIEIYTYLQMREDTWTLYGFEDKKQQRIFEMLIAVPGIGPKSAFTIISHKASDDLSQAILTNNVEFFSDIPGVGKKSAHKILLELSAKVGKAFDMSALVLSPEDSTVVDALVSLGFKRHQARTSISKLDTQLSIEEKIKKAIKIMTSKS